MNFHISVNLIFVSALLCFCRVVPGPIFWAVEAHICISNDSVVGESSCHIAMTVIQNQTCKKKERKYSNRVVFPFQFFRVSLCFSFEKKHHKNANGFFFKQSPSSPSFVTWQYGRSNKTQRLETEKLIRASRKRRKEVENFTFTSIFSFVGNGILANKNIMMLP